VDQEGARSSREFTIHFGGEAPEPGLPRLTITQQDGGGMTLTWEDHFGLYMAHELEEPFKHFSGALSPYKVDTVDQGFFKLGVKP